MSSPPMRSILTWVPVTFAIVAGAITWGVTTQRVQALEDAQSTAQSDHDNIVTMQAQMTAVQEDVREVKGDIKGIQKTMTENFTKIMLELQKRPSNPGG